MVPVYLFVYGTLRRGASADLAVQYPDAVRWHTTGWLQGHLYRISYYPGLVLHPDGPRVVGDIFELMRPSETLAMLDEFEACSPQHPPPHEYTRQRVTVQCAQSHAVPAWTYVYNHAVQTLNAISSGDFLNP